MPKQSTSSQTATWNPNEPPFPTLADQVASVVKAMVWMNEMPRGNRCHIRWRATEPKQIAGGLMQQKVVVDVIDLDSTQNEPPRESERPFTRPSY